jgi:hypothetical protein
MAFLGVAGKLNGSLDILGNGGSDEGVKLGGFKETGGDTGGKVGAGLGDDRNSGQKGIGGSGVAVVEEGV